MAKHRCELPHQQQIGEHVFAQDEPLICMEDEQERLWIEGDTGEHFGSFRFQTNFCPHCGFKAKVSVTSK